MSDYALQSYLFLLYSGIFLLLNYYNSRFFFGGFSFIWRKYDITHSTIISQLSITSVCEESLFMGVWRSAARISDLLAYWTTVGLTMLGRDSLVRFFSSRRVCRKSGTMGLAYRADYWMRRKILRSLNHKNLQITCHKDKRTCRFTKEFIRQIYWISVNTSQAWKV